MAELSYDKIVKDIKENGAYAAIDLAKRLALMKGVWINPAHPILAVEFFNEDETKSLTIRLVYETGLVIEVYYQEYNKTNNIEVLFKHTCRVV